jgi:hypothetical protein
VWFMVDDAVRTIACVVARAGASGVSAPLAD